jgi:MFS family permease
MGIIAGSAGLALAMGVGRFAFTPLFPLMRDDPGITIAAGSWLASANYIGYFIGALAAFCVRVDTRAAIRWSLLATAASTLGMGLTTSFPMFLALRATAGVASAFLLVCISAWALEHAGDDPLRRAAVFSGVGAGMFLVGIACLILQAQGVTAAGGWIALGAGSFVLAAMMWRAYEAPMAASPPVLGRCPIAGTWRLVVAYTAAGFGYIIPATFLPAMARAQVTSSAAVDLAWPALGLAACVSTFIAAKLFGAANGLRIWKWAQCVMVLSVALPALSHSVPALAASGVGVGGTFMVITMAAMQAARGLEGSDPRRLMALLSAGFAAGQLAGPLVVALLLNTEDNFSRPLALAAAALAAGVLVLPGTSARSINVISKET